MPILRGRLGKVPSGPKARVRNFIANKELGTQSDIHENVLSPGVVLPWHFHVTEEVIVVLEGRGAPRRQEQNFFGRRLSPNFGWSRLPETKYRKSCVEQAA